MSEFKAFLRNTNIELVIQDYKQHTNEKGIICRTAVCYTKAFDSIEEIPLDRIEIR